ncbi:hypothetical protein M0R45_008160 [Rubus argutus]|uniref:BHLH domain-containing protein n=1 Tax=Rubus argutus TaxID=59490 RepID=A0AAW1Y190_RUBAR
MNRALPEMLNCMNAPGSLVAGNCTDMTVLDRQRARMKWQHDQLQQQQQQQHQGYFGGSELNGVFSHLPIQASQQVQSFQGLIGLGDSGMGQAVKPDPVRKMETKNNNTVVTDKISSPAGKESFKKRKADKAQNNKAVAEDDISDKRIKGCAEEGESKASEVQKPDYIHVRARRGQATDSHSLAERVRREKISERMKYLQDLVPGCNKITGKAGMLDEIINYVQSLQRQVEFLSMKLAAVNPRLDFNIDDLFTKEMFPANMANFQSIGMSSEMTNSAYLQFNHVQQLLQCSGLESGITSPDSALLRRTISAPLSIPETFLDTSCFTQVQPPTTWDADIQNLFNVEFHQGRTGPFQSQPFTGSIEASNLKMEM